MLKPDALALSSTVEQGQERGVRAPEFGGPITPAQFLQHVLDIALDDPGTERKCMLFYNGSQELRFLGARSEARVMVLEFTPYQRANAEDAQPANEGPEEPQPKRRS